MALGLGHAGGYNGNAAYVTSTSDPDYGANSNIYLNDSWQTTMMSYFSQTENTTGTASYAHLISPMAADWIALDALYPLRTAFAGNTTWGFHTNITTTVFADLRTYAASSAFTVVDRGGIDTVDFSGFAVHQTIRLTQETYSDIGGLTGNMSIARGTVIENAIGGHGNDTDQRKLGRERADRQRRKRQDLWRAKATTRPTAATAPTRSTAAADATSCTAGPAPTGCSGQTPEWTP